MQWSGDDTEFAFIPVGMECDKAKRVTDTAKMIADNMCKLCIAGFEAERSSSMKIIMWMVLMRMVEEDFLFLLKS